MGDTKQKRAIEEIIFNSDKHMTVEEVYNLVRARMPHVSMATVYRNLNNLADNHRLARLTFPDGKFRFDRNTEVMHGHAYCTKCHKVFDLDPKVVSFQNLNQLDSFTAEAYELVLTGQCHACQNAISAPLKDALVGLKEDQ